MTAVRALFLLQEIDLEIDSRNRRMAQIDLLLRDDTALQTARKGLEAAEASLKDAVRRQLAAEEEADANKARSAQLEKRIYSAEATSRELTTVNTEIVHAKGRQGDLDGQALAAMESVENAKVNRDVAKATVQSLEQQGTAHRATLTQEKTRLQTEIGDINAKRRTFAGTLSEPSIKVYDRIRGSKGVVAVAKVERNSCSACRVALPSQLLQRARAGKEFVSCGSCGRLLLPA